MATYLIPDKQKNIRTKTRYDTDGIQTFNIDLTSKLDKLKTSRQLVKVLDEDDDFGGDNPCAFEIYKNAYYLATSGDLYRCSKFADPTDHANWSMVEDGLLQASTTDLVVFNNLLLVSSGGTKIGSFDGSSEDADWDDGKLTTTSADFTQMYVWKGDGEWLFVANGNKVHYYNTTAGEFIITLPDDLEVVGFTGGVSRVWVATRSTTGQDAFVYEVVPGRVYNVVDNGGAAVDTVPLPENVYRVDGKAAMSIATVDNVAYVVTDKGAVQAFTGSGFTTVATFPFANTTDIIENDAVHPKGMRVHNRSLFINISTERDNLDDFPVESPSGVWEYNVETGRLYHRFAFAETSGDYGWYETDSALIGPILIPNDDNAFIFGIAQRSVSGATLGVYIDQEANYGRIVTPEFESDSVTSAWESVYQKAKTLASGESIRLKYRTTKLPREFADCAYASTTQINTTDTLTNVAVGWEVIDTLTGKSAHITEISGGTTKAIKLDRALGSGSSRFLFQNFLLVPEEYTSEDGEYRRDGEFGATPWIQFVIEFVGDIEYRQFMLKSNSKGEL